MNNNQLSRVKKYNTEEIKQIDLPEIEYNEDEEKETRKHPLLTKIIITLFFIIILITAYATLISPYYIDIKEYKIDNEKLPESLSGFKIVQFSDIHYGNTIDKKQLDKIVTKINSLKPDLIFFTGDLISKDIEVNDEIKNEIKESLSKLECSMYKYSIYGDEDNNDIYNEIMNETNFIILNNESKLLYYKNISPIAITGLNSNENIDYSILNNNVNELDITSLFRIVLVHEPDTTDNILSYYPDIIMSGHTMGGLIKLPYLKPLFLPENGKNYYEDYYEINGTKLYVSNGLGTSSINARLNNHPSINLYRIYK